MTKTYHDVEAVTVLLQEKEKDLELAAKIGQELLERNKMLDDKVFRLETELAGNQNLISQLRHEVQVKSDLLHVYTSDLEEASPMELRSMNLEILQKKIQGLEEDNRVLHTEASKLANEAYACEEKEEKLVNDAVKHLTEANSQIKDLHSQFTHKIDESSRQREEINMLLAQVCDLQNRVQRYSHENDDLTANLRVYQETQDELTNELGDLKDKYREVVELLRDTQEQLKNTRKRTYPGMGRHNVSGMFSLPIMPSGEDSLQAEINSSLSRKSSRNLSKADTRNLSMLGSEDVSESDSDIPTFGSSNYRKAARTYKAIARGSNKKEIPKKDLASSVTSGKSSVKSAFQSYTISRENSFSPDFEDFEFGVVDKFEDDLGISDDSGHGRSTQMSGPDSLSSSAPKEDFKARELLRQATHNRLQSSLRESSGGSQTAASLSRTPTVFSSLGGSFSHNNPPRPNDSFPPPVFPGLSSGHSRTSSRLSDFETNVTASASGPLGSIPGLERASGVLGSVPGVERASGSLGSVPGLGSVPRGSGSVHGSRSHLPDNVEILEVQTVGTLKPPSFHLSSSLLQATPLGCVPGRGPGSLPTTPSAPPKDGFGAAASGHPGLGTLPGRRFSENINHNQIGVRQRSNDFDETEPLGSLTTNTFLIGEHSPSPYVDLGQEFDNGSNNSLGQSSSLGQVPSLGSWGQPPNSGLGQIPSLGSWGQPPNSGLGQIPSLGSLGQPPNSGLGQIPSLASFGQPPISSLGQMPPLGSFGQAPISSLGSFMGQLGSTGQSDFVGNLTTSSLATHQQQFNSTPGYPSSAHEDLEFDVSELGDYSVGEMDLSVGTVDGLDLSHSMDVSYDLDETEPIQSLSLTSTTLSKRIDCQIVGEEGVGTPDLSSRAEYGEWSYSDLRDSSGDIRFNNMPQRAAIKGVSRFGDSGVNSGDYSELSGLNKSDPAMPDIDALSDGGFCEMGTYPGIVVPEPGVNSALASALRHLNPAEVQRRRNLLGELNEYDLMSEAGDVELAVLDDDILPYGVHRDDIFGISHGEVYGADRKQSQRSSNADNRSWMGSSLSGRLHRLPDKLRIVKPLEGSLTLHHWSKLATPHLGGVLEERVGVAIKGNDKAGLDPLFNMYSLEEEEEDSVVPSVRQPTRTYNTLTMSTVLHPDTTQLSSAYSSSVMASGLNSQQSTRPPSRLRSRCNSVGDPGSREGVAFSTNIGLARILNDKNIAGIRGSQIDLSSGTPAMSSLTPSCLNSPTQGRSRNLSPTATPPHTPKESLPGSPDEEDSSGLVYSFFASLKSAIYGQQRREDRNSRHKRRLEDRRTQLGIMEAVEEAGVETLLSDRESTPGSLPGLSDVEPYRPPPSSSSSSAKSSKSAARAPVLGDFDARYLGVLDDFDELEDIEPGSLTVSRIEGDWNRAGTFTKAWVGQLTVPSLTSAGRPSLTSHQLGSVPSQATESVSKIGVPGVLSCMGGRGPGRIAPPGQIRPHHLSGLGIPGHAGTGAVGQAVGDRRRDLGTIPGGHFSSDPGYQRGQYLSTEDQNMPRSNSFMGSISSMFGRKGGYL